MNTDKKKNKKKKIHKIIRRTVVALAFLGIVLSTIPGIEYENAIIEYQNSIPAREYNETKKEYIGRLFKTAIESNKNLGYSEKARIIDVFTRLVIDEIGDYIESDTLVNLMAVASTETVTELNIIEKKFSWYQGYYSPYFNRLVLNAPVDEVDETLLAHEQLHAILRNSFNKNAYALNETITRHSVKGDESYLYLNRYYEIIEFIVGKDKLMHYYLNGDIEGLKKELTNYLSESEVQDLLLSSDNLVFSKFTTTLLQNIGLDNNNFLLKDALKQQDTAEETSESLLTKAYENKFDCKLENSSLGKVLFGYYTPEIKGLTLIKEKVGYFEPMCHLEYLADNKVKVTIELLTSNVNTSTNDFYKFSEEYIIPIEEFATTDLDDLIEDAKKKHQRELTEKPLDKKYTLS